MTDKAALTLVFIKYSACCNKGKFSSKRS